MTSIDDARKLRKDADQALELAKGMDRIVVARGKKVIRFDMKKEPPDDATLLSHLLGPSGNLRAPALRKGKSLYIGFNDEAFQDLA